MSKLIAISPEYYETCTLDGRRLHAFPKGTVIVRVGWSACRFDNQPRGMRVLIDGRFMCFCEYSLFDLRTPKREI